MALKDTITKWHAAMTLLEGGSFTACVTKLLDIQQPSAKILHNVGCAYVLNGDLNQAIQFFSSSLEMDKYLALSYYQRAICHFQIQKFDRAELDFLTAKSMINQDSIDYRQLGANIVLSASMMDDCVKAARSVHLHHRGSALSPEPPMSCVFYPPKKMVANLAKQNFLGKAKVISSVEESDIVYATGKKPEPKLRPPPLPSHQPSSLPSSPATSPSLPSRQQRGKGSRGVGSSVFVPPPPRRPPPRLPSDSSLTTTLPRQQVMKKSRSVEDILDVDVDSHLYEDVDSPPPESRFKTRSDLLFSHTPTASHLKPRAADDSGVRHFPQAHSDNPPTRTQKFEFNFPTEGNRSASAATTTQLPVRQGSEGNRPFTGSDGHLVGSQPVKKEGHLGARGVVKTEGQHKAGGPVKPSAMPSVLSRAPPGLMQALSGQPVDSRPCHPPTTALKPTPNAQSNRITTSTKPSPANIVPPPPKPPKPNSTQALRPPKPGPNPVFNKVPNPSLNSQSNRIATFPKPVHTQTNIPPTPPKPIPNHPKPVARDPLNRPPARPPRPPPPKLPR